MSARQAWDSWKAVVKVLAKMADHCGMRETEKFICFITNGFQKKLLKGCHIVGMCKNSQGLQGQMDFSTASWCEESSWMY
jgi:hypothetical protein